LRRQFDLDGSKLEVRGGHSELLHGNLGISLQSRRPVITEIVRRLADGGSGHCHHASMIIGVWIGIRRVASASARRVVTTFTMFTYAVPDFWLA
jgi:ABC-type dipeptide/oligopeptide/nickel transport system permease component